MYTIHYITVPSPWDMPPFLVQFSPLSLVQEAVKHEAIGRIKEWIILETWRIANQHPWIPWMPGVQKTRGVPHVSQLSNEGSNLDVMKIQRWFQDVPDNKHRNIDKLSAEFGTRNCIWVCLKTDCTLKPWQFDWGKLDVTWTYIFLKQLDCWISYVQTNQLVYLYRDQVATLGSDLSLTHGVYLWKFRSIFPDFSSQWRWWEL